MIKKLKDLEAKNYLFQALDRSILEMILNKDTKISRNNSSQACILASTSKGI